MSGRMCGSTVAFKSEFAFVALLVLSTNFAIKRCRSRGHTKCIPYDGMSRFSLNGILNE
jgi:hypothetical protein